MMLYLLEVFYFVGFCVQVILKPPPAGVRGSDDSGLGSHGVQATNFRQTAPGNHQVLTTFKYMFFLCQMHLQSSTL